MKFGIDVATGGKYANPRKLAELAAQAEQAGWDGFFSGMCFTPKIRLTCR